MSLKARIGLWLAHRRAAAIRKEAREAVKLQEKTFQSLISRARTTAFGQAHQFDRIKTHQDFVSKVPVRNYEQNREWFDRIYQGEDSVAWPGKPLYLAKTSGTTSGAKYIPITRESIRKQVKGARDAIFLYMHGTGNSSFLDGKMMFLSGSPEIETNAHGIQVGRLSGIVNHFVPSYLTANRVPSYEANIIEDWETKVSTIVKEIQGEDLRLISGIPPWVQMLFEELEAQTGKKPLEVWPNLQVFIQGGVDFSPYQPIFDQYFGDQVGITEVFPASEGFFGVQYRPDEKGLMLMPDYGIFYEFIPMDEYGKSDARRLTLAEVEVGVQYALILSTNAGLWAYDIGDTVIFTSVDPWILRVSGRTKHFISAFGEHVISEEVNKAILEAVEQTDSSFHEFTVCPLIHEEKGESAHEWLIEFSQPPEDLEQFAEILDQAMQRQNPYYLDLREGAILKRAVITPLQLNASRDYMKSQGKLGGQNKFPRLSNDRKIADKLAPFRM